MQLDVANALYDLHCLFGYTEADLFILHMLRKGPQGLNNGPRLLNQLLELFPHRAGRNFHASSDGDVPVYLRVQIEQPMGNQKHFALRLLDSFERTQLFISNALYNIL